MKKLILIAVVLALASCEGKYEKPFIITTKCRYYGQWAYGYQDKNGQYKSFYEGTDKYNVGDTIK